MDSLKLQNNGQYNDMVIGTLAVDGRTVIFGTARTGLGGCVPAQCPHRGAHPSTARVPTSYYSMWHCNCVCSL